MPVHGPPRPQNNQIEHPVHETQALVFFQGTQGTACLVFPGGTICLGCRDQIPRLSLKILSHWVCLGHSPRVKVPLGILTMGSEKYAYLAEVNHKLPFSARLLQWDFFFHVFLLVG